MDGGETLRTPISGDKVYVKQTSGLIEHWKHIPLRITRTHFVSDGTTLSGMFVEPVSSAKDKPALIDDEN